MKPPSPEDSATDLRPLRDSVQLGNMRERCSAVFVGGLQGWRVCGCRHRAVGPQSGHRPRSVHLFFMTRPIHNLLTGMQFRSSRPHLAAAAIHSCGLDRIIDNGAYVGPTRRLHRGARRSRFLLGSPRRPKSPGEMHPVLRSRRDDHHSDPACTTLRDSCQDRGSRVKIEVADRLMETSSK